MDSACFIVSQFVLSIYLDKRWLERRDPLYGYRLRSLQARLAESPQSPLFLILGSSRVKYSVWPAAMKIHTTENAPQPIVYNFAMNGMGTIRELMYYRRLLADGIRPDWLMIEVWPPLWAEDGFFREVRMVLGEDDLHWRDLPLVCRYFRRDLEVLRMALRHSFLPISDYRATLLASVVPSLLARGLSAEKTGLVHECLPADRGGWFPLPFETIDAGGQSNAPGATAWRNFSRSSNQLHIDPRSDTALRELLAECRQRGIKTALILMPEPSRTRDWYSPQSRVLVHDYLHRIQRDHSMPIVDARAWQPDDDFADTCHMGRQGVPAFSARLGRDVVQPLIDGRPLASSVLLAEQDPKTP